MWTRVIQYSRRGNTYQQARMDAYLGLRSMILGSFISKAVDPDLEFGGYAGKNLLHVN